MFAVNYKKGEREKQNVERSLKTIIESFLPFILSTFYSLLPPMLKKILIGSLVIAAGISPILPRVFADNASWKPLLADRVWDESTYRVDRLTFNSAVSDPMKRNGIAFVSNPSAQCTDLGTCDKIDVSILKEGKTQILNAVDQQFLNPSFAMAQKGKFLFFTKSANKNYWVDVWFVDPNTGEVHPFTSLTRKPNELSFVSFSTSGDRMYSSLLQSNTESKKVQSSIVAKSKDGTYEERNIAFMLNAPWQQVMDAYNDKLLVKFQFSGGNKQLWLINPASQVMSAIPNTWTDPHADILFPHFLSNGTVVFFQNYRLYTYNPANDAEPQTSEGALLSWDRDVNQNVQIVGDRMVWTDVNHVLHAVGLEGAIAGLPAVKDDSVHLEKDAVYFANAKGSWKYDFVSDALTQTPFLVADVQNDVRVGTDAQGNIWYENTANQKQVKLGYGTRPVLTDDSHVIWKGKDGAIYQATLSVLLSFRSTDKVFEGGLIPGQRVKAVGDPRVYMVGNDGALHWIVSETVANTIYGSKWNKGITEVSPTFLWRYSNGTNIESNQSLKTL